MRVPWACPDLGAEKPDGMEMPVTGSNDLFPECPAAYLRTAADVKTLRLRRGGRPFDEHLISGHRHPSIAVSAAAFEVRNGARTLDSLSPKVADLVQIFIREEGLRDKNDIEIGRKERERQARRGR